MIHLGFFTVTYRCSGHYIHDHEIVVSLLKLYEIRLYLENLALKTVERLSFSRFQSLSD